MSGQTLVKVEVPHCLGIPVARCNNIKQLLRDAMSFTCPSFACPIQQTVSHWSIASIEAAVYDWW